MKAPDTVTLTLTMEEADIAAVACGLCASAGDGFEGREYVVARQVEEKLNDAMQSPQPSYEEVLRELADTVTDWIEGEDESVARMEAATFRARALLATGAASTREERDQREAEGTHELLAHFRDERARLSRLLAQLLEAVEEHRGYAAEGGLVADIAQLENKTQPPRLLTDDEIRDLEAENDHKLWDLAAQIQRSNESEEG